MTCAALPRSNSYFTRGVSLLALVFFSAPLTATGATLAPPALVTDCRGGVTSIALVEVAAFDVTFRNMSRARADEIRITITYDHGKVARFDVFGKFPPNADIKKSVHKSVGHGSYAFESAHNACRVHYVHFTNGSSWSDGRS